MDNKKEEILNMWYKHDETYSSKLDKVVEKLILKYGGLYQKDLDDFKSIANYVFFDILKRWDGERNFNNLLLSSLTNKFKTEMRDRNRKKKGGNGGLKFESKFNNTNDPTGEKRYREKEKTDSKKVEISSLDNEENGINYYELIPYGKTIEDIVFKEDTNRLSENCKKVLESLSRKQKSILLLKMEGYSADEICNKMNITYGDYLDLMDRIRANSKVRELLFAHG